MQRARARSLERLSPAPLAGRSPGAAGLASLPPDLAPCCLLAKANNFISNKHFHQISAVTMRLFEVQMEDTQICSGQTAELTVEKNKKDKEAE